MFRTRATLVDTEIEANTAFQWWWELLLAVILADVASIDIQQEIQWFMRPFIVDFLVKAQAAFQLLPETRFLAVNLLDRSVETSRLQETLPKCRMCCTPHRCQVLWQ